MAGNHDGAELKQLQEVWTLMYRSDLVIADALQQAPSQSCCRRPSTSAGSWKLPPVGADGARCRCRAADGSAADQHR